MLLRTPAWAKEPLRAASAASSSSASSGSAQSPISDVVLSLTNRRLYREVTLALRTGLRDARAEFSFMRVKGLRTLSRFLASAVKSEKIVELFLESQSHRDLQVVPVLFEYILTPQTHERSNPDVVFSTPSSNEISLALRVLEVCCLLDAGSRLSSSRFAATKVLMGLLHTSTPAEQIACLDAFLAVLLDSTSNQKEFDRIHGVQKVAVMVKSTDVDAVVRLKCAEFLLLLVGRILPASARAANGFPHSEGRKIVMTVEGARQGVVETLGRQAGKILDALPSSEAGIADFDAEQTSLTNLARKLVALS